MERAIGDERPARHIIKEGDLGKAVRALLSELDACLGNMAVNPKLRARFNEISDSIETLTREAMCPKPKVDWEAYGLTPGQERLCNILLTRLGQTVGKGTIMNQLYFDRSVDDVPQTKILDVLVCNVRKRLKDTDCPYRIETPVCRGYRMVLAKSEPERVAA